MARTEKVNNHYQGELGDLNTDYWYKGLRVESFWRPSLILWWLNKRALKPDFLGFNDIHHF